jgi:sodium-dependent phosphate transporter
VYRGAHSVRWWYHLPEFPFVGGVVAIVASWLISPLLTGAVAAAGFAATRGGVLRRRNSVALSFWVGRGDAVVVMWWWRW